MRKKLYITQEPIKQYSGFKPMFRGIPILKKNHYNIIHKSVGGAAPKELVRGYFFGVCKSNRRVELIAKVGHKNYPHESINEMLLTRIGQVMGLEMAEGYLAFIGGQLRYFSKNFLRSSDELIHGASILSAYCGNDKEFIQLIEQEKKTRELLSFQVIEDAIRHVFPHDASAIMTDYSRMLLYDALVGHQDRHHYNWAIVRSIKNNTVKFSPIYDTARALFWNNTEERLRKEADTHGIENVVQKYADKCRPKTGWDGVEDSRDFNHFMLMENLLNTEYILRSDIDIMISETMLGNIVTMIEKEFSDMISPLRIEFIVRSLHYRFTMINEIYRSLNKRRL